MAIEGYSDLNLLPSIDNDGIEGAFQSLTALKEAARRDFVSLECDPINFDLRGESRDGESCGELFPNTEASSVDAREKCIYLLTTRFTFDEVGSFDGRIDPVLNYTVVCGGRVIGNGTAVAGIVSGLTIAAECDIGEDVQICADIDINQTGVGQNDGGGGGRVNWR